MDKRVKTRVRKSEVPVPRGSDQGFIAGEIVRVKELVPDEGFKTPFS